MEGNSVRINSMEFFCAIFVVKINKNSRKKALEHDYSDLVSVMLISILRKWMIWFLRIGYPIFSCDIFYNLIGELICGFTQLLEFCFEDSIRTVLEDGSEQSDVVIYRSLERLTGLFVDFHHFEAQFCRIQHKNSHIQMTGELFAEREPWFRPLKLIRIMPA